MSGLWSRAGSSRRISGHLHLVSVSTWSLWRCGRGRNRQRALTPEGKWEQSLSCAPAPRAGHRRSQEGSTAEVALLRAPGELQAPNGCAGLVPPGAAPSLAASSGHAGVVWLLRGEMAVGEGGACCREAAGRPWHIWGGSAWVYSSSASEEHHPAWAVLWK